MAVRAKVLKVMSGLATLVAVYFLLRGTLFDQRWLLWFFVAAVLGAVDHVREVVPTAVGHALELCFEGEPGRRRPGDRGSGSG